MTQGRSVSEPVVREATIDDVHYIGPRLRAADRQECLAFGILPMFGLAYSYGNSERCFTVEVDGEPVAIFGVGPDHADVPPNGCVWMLGTDRLSSIRYPFLRRCRKWVDELHKDYRVIGNWADTRNLLHVRWLQWLGFKIINTAPIGKQGEMFHHFIKVK